MTFEVFRNEQSRTRATIPTVTITGRGTFTLSPAAVRALGDPRAVELLYDPDTRVIGLRAADPDVPHGYAVRSSAGKMATVSGSAFTSRYGIPRHPAVRRRAEVRAGVLCIDLNDPGAVVTSNRAKL